MRTDENLPVKAVIRTFGCRLNQSETALIADDLHQAGFDITGKVEDAGLVVINGCVVTANAARKSRREVRSIRRQNPEAFIVITGCPAELSGEMNEERDGVDLLVPNTAKREITKHLPVPLKRPEKTITASSRKGETKPVFVEAGAGYYPHRTRANLKIQEGCDAFCSYCIVPYTRGKPRSRDWHDVLREARELLRRGHRELVLTGVNIALYHDRNRSLADLLKALNDLDGDFRIRLSSTEPCEKLYEVIGLISEFPRLCRYLHIPLQHGADRILKEMNRPYGFEECREFFEKAVEMIPDICLGSDVIIGFPGESENDFVNSLENIADLPLTYLHVFSFSPRPGTVAAGLSGRVDGGTINERKLRIQKLAAEKTRKFSEQMRGRRLTVLPETVNADGDWEGWSDNYIRTVVRKDGTAQIQGNQFVEVEVVEILGDRLVLGREVCC